MKKSIFYKIIFIAAVLGIALGLVYIALEETVPDLIPLLETGNADAIQAYLRESGTAKGIFCTVLLQMVQVWSLFISGVPIQVAAGCVFGLMPAFAVCHLSSVLAQLIALIVWRKAGARLQKWMPVDTDKNSRFNDFLDSKAPPAYIVILACFVPVLPNGLIALLAAKMDIGVGKYTLCVWAGSIINVLVCCAVGNRIVQGDWLFACLLAAMLAAMAILLWVLRERILSLWYRVTKQKQA